MQIGIFGGTGSQAIDDIVTAAHEAEQDGFASFSLPQIFGLDALGLLAIIGREVPRIELTTFVIPTYSRLPLTMAQQSINITLTSGGRFTLGIGLSHQIVIENMFGLSFDKPLRHMREYLSVLVPLLNNEPADFDGETISMHVAIDTPERPRTPLIVAALGPKMLELAGTVTDGTATWMTGPATLASHTVPTIAAAAEKAGRPAPKIYSSLPVCVTSNVDAAHKRAAKDFQMYGFLPSYRAMLDREGAAGPADVAIVGDEATVIKGLAQMEDAGTTHFVASIFGNRDEREATRALLKSQL